MTGSSLTFKCALITGGGGGIGKAIATSLITRGIKVILAGRSASSLSSTASEIGAAAYYVLDVGDIPSIPSFLDTLLKDHPDLDCLINNAGVQRPFHLARANEYPFDLARADEEININIRGPMHLCVQLVRRQFGDKDKCPHGHGATIMNVSSVLGFVPFSVVNPVYNGTKAWLHSFTVNLRTQLEQKSKEDGSCPPIRVIEIVPPSVETDLHRDRTDPDDNKKKNGSNAQGLDEFMREVEQGWETGLETIAPGLAAEHVRRWDEGMGQAYREMIQ